MRKSQNASTKTYLYTEPPSGELGPSVVSGRDDKLHFSMGNTSMFQTQSATFILKKVARVSPGLYLLKRPRRVVNFSYSFFCCWFCCFASPRALLTFTINSSEHAVSCNFPRPRLFDFLTLSLALHHPCEALAHTWVGAVVVFLLGWLRNLQVCDAVAPTKCFPTKVTWFL